MDEYTSNVVNTMITNVHKLIKEGATQIVIFDMPDLAITPRFKNGTMKQYRQVISETIQMHNQKLKQAVDDIQAKKKVHIALFDISNKLSAIIGHANDYGFTVTDQACVSSVLLGASHTQNQQQLSQHNPELALAAAISQPMLNLQANESPFDFHCDNPASNNPNPDNYIFFDDVHPTTHTHRIIATVLTKFLKQQHFIDASVIDTIEPEQQCRPTHSIRFDPSKYYQTLDGLF